MNCLLNIAFHRAFIATARLHRESDKPRYLLEAVCRKNHRFIQEGLGCVFARSLQNSDLICTLNLLEKP